MSKIHGVTIGDVHIGATPAKQLRQELWKVFFPHLLSKDKLDIVVIAGDLFDTKLTLNGEDAKLAIDFMDTLVKVCKKKKSILRIIRGTRNHDLNQLNNFIYLEKDKTVDVRIFNSVAKERVLGLDILWLPEEYMEDQEKYYEEYFNDTYDLAFFHGTFQHVGFSKALDSERPMKHAPVFSYTDFEHMVHGAVMGGHIHNGGVYKDKIYYTHSFSRWKHGEEEVKGFLDFSYDKKTHECEVTRIENILARVYRTIDISKLLKKNSVEKVIKYIKKLKKDSDIYDLKTVISKPEEVEESDLQIIRSYFNNDSTQKVKVTVKNTKQDQVRDEAKQLLETYSFIFNDELPKAEQISKFMELKNGVHIAPDVVESILYPKEKETKES